MGRVGYLLEGAASALTAVEVVTGHLCKAKTGDQAGAHEGPGPHSPQWPSQAPNTPRRAFLTIAPEVQLEQKCRGAGGGEGFGDNRAERSGRPGAWSEFPERLGQERPRGSLPVRTWPSVMFRRKVSGSEQKSPVP